MFSNESRAAPFITLFQRFERSSAETIIVALILWTIYHTNTFGTFPWVLFWILFLVPLLVWYDAACLLHRKFTFNFCIENLQKCYRTFRFRQFARILVVSSCHVVRRPTPLVQYLFNMLVDNSLGGIMLDARAVTIWVCSFGLRTWIRS